MLSSWSPLIVSYSLAQETPSNPKVEVVFPGLDEVRASYKARYLPFYVEEADHTGEEATGDDTPAGRLTHISAPSADYHVTHNNHAHTAPHLTAAHQQGHHAPGHHGSGEEEHTARMTFRPPPREHADNQQDFEDTVRTRQ